MAATPRRSGDGAVASPAAWFPWGAAVGWLDWALASRFDAEAAGPWWERVATGVVAMVGHGLLVVAVAAVVGLVARRWRGRGPVAASVAAVAGAVVVVSVLWHTGIVLTFDEALWPGVGAVVALAPLAWLVERRWALPRPRPRWSLPVLGAVLLAVASLPGQWKTSPAPGERANVVLVSVDTLRADRLGCYGYERATSPAIDALATGAVVFEDAYAQSNWTLPSHASLFTGVGPLAHGALGSDAVLSERATTLAERLRAEGYATAALVGVGPYFFVGSARGFGQGFDSFRHAPHVRPFRPGFLPRAVDAVAHRYLAHGVGEAEVLTGQALRWLEGHRREPFFLFLHYYDVHSKFHDLPYEAPPPFFDRFCPGELDGFTGDFGTGTFASRFLREVVAERLPMPDDGDLAKMSCLYDGAVAYVDHELGRLFAALAATGLDERTVVIVTADHGESLGDHGSLLHETVYDDVARVPLIVRAPGGAGGRRVEGVVRLTDVVPTVLELVGAPPAEVVEGVSRAALVMAPGTATGTGAMTVGKGVRWSMGLRQGPLKYILNREVQGRTARGVPVEELFDLDRDPGERLNLTGQDSHRADLESISAELDRRRRAAERLKRHHFADPDATPLEVPDEEAERLRALGYAE